MGIVRMRNKITGEFQDADDASVDFLRMKQEVGPDGQSKWEQTGDHHVRAAVARARGGDLREGDLGSEFMPLSLSLPLDVQLGPEVAPHRALTPAEIENGLDSQEQKAEEEREMHLRALMGFADENQIKTAREQAEKGEGPLAQHPTFVRERALASGSTAILERSEVEGMEDENESDEEQEAPRRRSRSRAHRSRAGGPATEDDAGESGGEEGGS